MRKAGGQYHTGRSDALPIGEDQLERAAHMVKCGHSQVFDPWNELPLERIGIADECIPRHRLAIVGIGQVRCSTDPSYECRPGPTGSRRSLPT